MEIQQDPFNYLFEVWQHAGWLGLAGAILMIFVKALSGNTVQNLLGMIAPKTTLWVSWPDWLRRVIVFCLALIGGVLTAIAGGMSWPAAMISTLPVAFAAHVLHSAIKWDNSKTDAQIQADALSAAQSALAEKKTPTDLSPL